MQCSKTTPCLKCTRDALPCQYPHTGRKLISGTEWRHNTVYVPSPKQSAPNAGGPIKEAYFFQQFFYVFLQRNQFTGDAAKWHRYLSTNVTRCRGHFAALAALGALVQYKQRHDVTLPARLLESALRSYQDGVHFLQIQIDRRTAQWDPVSVLSVAFLLSMFEVLGHVCAVQETSLMLIIDIAHVRSNGGRMELSHGVRHIRYSASLRSFTLST